MKIGFYGNNIGRLSISQLLLKNNIKVDAVYMDNVQVCVETAVKLGARACFELTELTENCDVIIVSVGDDAHRKAILKLSKCDLSGKIVIVESTSVICDTFDEIGSDVVATAFTPDGSTLYIEGKGSGFIDFRRYLSENGVGINNISPRDKEKYDLAMFYVESGISTLVATTREMMGDVENFDDIVMANAQNALISGGKANIVDRFDVGAIRRYNENARGNNLAVYQTLVLKALETADLSADEKERIKSIIIGR